MIAPKIKDYLLIHEAAPLLGLSEDVLRRQVKAGRIPESYLVRSGERRPVIRIHRSWIERAPTPAAITCEALIPWSVK